MHERKICDGCGSERFVRDPGFATEVGSEPVETVVWRCGGCGSETTVLDPVDADLLDAATAPRRRRAA